MRVGGVRGDDRAVDVSGYHVLIWKYRAPQSNHHHTYMLVKPNLHKAGVQVAVRDLHPYSRLCLIHRGHRIRHILLECLYICTRDHDAQVFKMMGLGVWW